MLKPVCTFLFLAIVMSVAQGEQPASAAARRRPSVEGQKPQPASPAAKPAAQQIQGIPAAISFDSAGRNSSQPPQSLIAQTGPPAPRVDVSQSAQSATQKSQPSQLLPSVVAEASSSRPEL